jgi:hypothetical protein
MGADWKEFIKGRDLHLDGTRVVVELGSRRHQVRIRDEDDGWDMEATALGPKEAERSGWTDREVWMRNRRSRLISLRFDRKHRLVAHAWAPKVGNTPTAFRFVVREVAREADRQELLGTGRDRR